MKGLEIVISTTISPAKVNINDLALALEKLLNEHMRESCRAITFREHGADHPMEIYQGITSIGDGLLPSYACECRTCGINFASTLKAADWCGCTKEKDHGAK